MTGRMAGMIHGPISSLWFFLTFFYCCSIAVVSIFPTATLPHPIHPHFPHLILPPFGFVHVSFGERGAQLIVLPFGLIRTALSR